MRWSARESLCFFLQGHLSRKLTRESVQLGTYSHFVWRYSVGLNARVVDQQKSARGADSRSGSALPGRPREWELERPISISREQSTPFASEHCPSLFRLERTGQNRSAEYCRAGPVTFDRNSAPLTDLTTVHRCRLSANIPPPRLLCHCQNHSWRATMCPISLLREKCGIGRRSY